MHDNFLNVLNSIFINDKENGIDLIYSQLFGQCQQTELFKAGKILQQQQQYQQQRPLADDVEMVEW